MEMLRLHEKTKATIDSFALKDFSGDVINWSGGQYEIADPILHRQSVDGRQRIEIIASTQYGKSLTVGGAVAIRVSSFPEPWAIVAGTKEKARIIMDYIIMYSLNNPAIRSQLPPKTSLDRMRQKRSQDRLSYRGGGEVRVYSADASKVTETSKSLMGFGSPNVIEDESGLIPDKLQATVMRMLGGHKDNFLVKIGNPFNRNHFLRTWQDDRYFKVFIDYKRALEEGRYSPEFIEEMRKEAMFDVLYECKFPEEGLVDEKGWLPLLTESEIERAFVDEGYHLGVRKFGADVAGGGRNYSVVVERSQSVAQKIYKKTEPDTSNFGSAIGRLMILRNIADDGVYIDRVGIGKGLFDYMRKAKPHVNGVSAGMEPVDKQRYINLRAEMFWRVREWVLAGGKLVKDEDWYQLTNVKYKIDEVRGKLKIMSKEEMLKNGVDSPDVADALSLTFAHNVVVTETPTTGSQQHTPEIDALEENDPYAR